MRDHNNVLLSGTLQAKPVVFSTGTKKGCKFNLIVRDEWKNAETGEPEERFDEIHIVCHGPVRSRALEVPTDAHVLLTARVRTSGDGRIYLEAKTIEVITPITLYK